MLFDGDIKTVFTEEIDFVKLLQLETRLKKKTDLLRDSYQHQLIKPENFSSMQTSA